MFYASLIPFVLVSLVCYKVLQWVTKERKINALGGRANKVRSYLPFGEKVELHPHLKSYTKAF